MLSWHDGGIPQIEIWLKLDGDHGGGSFKFCLLNVKHPNSKTSTFLVRMFEAKDNVENLKRVLGSDEFKQGIRALQSMAWRGKRVRVIFCGDYGFRCKTFVLSEARGYHPSLWCLTTKDKIKKGPKHCVPAQPKATKSLKNDFQSFEVHGSGKKIKGEGI